MKKRAIILFALFTIFIPSVVYADTANRTTALIYINTDNANNVSMQTMSVVTVYAYNINGNNYFKLRDIAQMLTTKNIGFSVEWNETENIIEINTENPYIRVGNELEFNRNDEKIQFICFPQETIININGEIFETITYNIEGNNYFQLRELGNLLGFEVNWLESENAIQILK